MADHWWLRGLWSLQILPVYCYPPWCLAFCCCWLLVYRTTLRNTFINSSLVVYVCVPVVIANGQAAHTYRLQVHGGWSPCATQFRNTKALAASGDPRRASLVAACLQNRNDSPVRRTRDLSGAQAERPETGAYSRCTIVRRSEMPLALRVGSGVYGSTYVDDLPIRTLSNLVF